MSCKRIQTKRNSKNKHNWEKHVGYATRMINRARYFKFKNIGE